jgi:alpha-tubulin suppressor-like RCC1 family protein
MHFVGDYENRYIPCLINSLNNVVMVSAGVRHVLVLDSDGRVLSFGSGGYGTLGVREEYSNIPILVEIPSVRSISSGNFHNLFVTHSDGLWCCGNNCQVPVSLKYNSIPQLKTSSLPSIIP